MDLRRFSTPINFITFQLCWFGCVLGAANDMGWLGPVLVLITVPLQVHYLAVNRRVEYIFVLLGGTGGFVLETLMIRGGVYVPIGGGSIAPLWMTALWLNFGPLVSLSLSWLKGKYWLAAVLGGLAGPVAYWGGEKLGALNVAELFTQGYVPLALMWALVLPCLVFLHNTIRM